jgi:hypothetical protein
MIGEKGRGLVEIARTILTVVGALATAFTCVLAIVALAAPQIVQIVLPPLGSTPEPQVVYVTIPPPTIAAGSPVGSQTPVVTTVPRGPIVVTATPRQDEQDPAPGSIISAGEAYVWGDITIRLRETMEYDAYDDAICFTFEIHNGRPDQYLVRWRMSAIHLRDDLDRQYAQYAQNEGVYSRVKAFLLEPDETRLLEATNYVHLIFDPDTFGCFQGPISQDANYLLLTIDEIAGFSDLNWRYELQ